MTIITVIGSLNYDLVTFTKKVPEAGETYQADAFENHLGGKGLNEALASSRLSADDSTQVRMIGNVGSDTFGKELVHELEVTGVNTTYVKTIEGKASGVAVILVEEDSGENRILITAGANGELKPTEDDYSLYFPREEADAHYLILQNEYPDTFNTITWIKQNRPNINIAYNPSPFKPEFITSEVLSRIDLFIVNEGEAMDVAKHLLQDEEYSKFEASITQNSIEGFKSLALKLQTLVNQNNIKTIIITMGSRGATYVSKETEVPQYEPSRKVQHVVDTTGAGDTFFGGVVSSLAGGKKIEDAVKFATTASSLAIQKKGAAESIPHYDEVLKNL
ncbi:ribokinase [Scheffersomyces stipitis CBS 6054]|uniref:Ribokinase n=1 Tax=Scheffersomyces stipitis (strain ATCC 58785 / CBS 6054 / NBRC 10063 / NRRL Y-11545) TaxID=322104 RepID=A3GI10_PICST|nr:ribokinase [Scheffersomyces stipitis CBS 6054]EAZ63149.2 ribokinase [Scheffersomyces stipitis CBS 6054]